MNYDDITQKKNYDYGYTTVYNTLICVLKKKNTHYSGTAPSSPKVSKNRQKDCPFISLSTNMLFLIRNDTYVCSTATSAYTKLATSSTFFSSVCGQYRASLRLR